MTEHDELAYTMIPTLQDRTQDIIQFLPFSCLESMVAKCTNNAQPTAAAAAADVGVGVGVVVVVVVVVVVLVVVVVVVVIVVLNHAMRQKVEDSLTRRFVAFNTCKTRI